ncbi:ankyrin repeat-containing domain protein [Aspergillus multicolor]|uniref:ankyrin repeat domain-containing protein n=1 Tax=Aspergillus multicolor TaxID=41759 RepID=UPI003CCE0C39
MPWLFCRLRFKKKLVDDEEYPGLVQSALLNAIRHVQVQLVPMLIEDVGSLDFGYGVALKCVVGASSLELVNLLLRHGADPDGAEPWDKNSGADLGRRRTQSATGLAAAKCLTDFVEVLVGAGRDPGFLDETGRTPLLFAAEGGHIATVQLLLGYGVEVTRRDKIWHRRPLDWAVCGLKLEVVEILKPLMEGGWW